jgi:hypothetical protein
MIKTYNEIENTIVDTVVINSLHAYYLKWTTFQSEQSHLSFSGKLTKYALTE